MTILYRIKEQYDHLKWILMIKCARRLLQLAVGKKYIWESKNWAARAIIIVTNIQDNPNDPWDRIIWSQFADGHRHGDNKPFPNDESRFIEACIPYEEK